jgi:hypothetical protein
MADLPTRRRAPSQTPCVVLRHALRTITMLVAGIRRRRRRFSCFALRRFPRRRRRRISRRVSPWSSALLASPRCSCFAWNRSSQPVAAAFASLRERRLLERPKASSRESTSCLCIGCDGFGRVALLLVVHADSRAPARQQRVRRAPRRPHGGTAGWTPRVPEDGRGMPRACPGWW